MKPWQFKQKTIGFGISKNAYWSILAATANLPPLLSVVNPKGEGEAVEGFLAPLSGGSKEDLTRSMMRGVYAVTTLNRKTVLKLRVFSKEEAGFDPGPFLNSELSQKLGDEIRARVGATWSLMQLTVESHEPFVHDSLRFILSVCQRLAYLTSGVVADPIAMTYKLPEEVFSQPQINDKVDVRDHVLVHQRGGSELHLYSKGMQKFLQPEVEIYGVAPSSERAGKGFIYTLCQQALLGDLYGQGDRVGSKDALMQLSHGGLDRSMWEGIPCLELIPPPGKTTTEGVEAWQESLP